MGLLSSYTPVAELVVTDSNQNWKDTEALVACSKGLLVILSRDTLKQRGIVFALEAAKLYKDTRTILIHGMMSYDIYHLIIFRCRQLLLPRPKRTT